MECTYTGQDMGERKVVATIKWATPIDFQIGDYIELQMQTLLVGEGVEGAVGFERFYIYTMPTIKKNARPMSSGEAFEHTVTFYPRQYELAAVQMRDCIQASANADTIIYTGFDQVSFVGGAHELMERIMACLKETFHDANGNGLWSYQMAPSVNEDANTSLERFPLSFSGNSIMDALLKLNDKEGINTTFFINERTIYVGYKRPYFCRVTDGMSIDTNIQTQIFKFQYGKTSHLPLALDHGGLYSITKTPGNESPITKLYAYGAARNLNRYYCSDRIRSGRYVNKLMLPSFDNDGRTDYVLSEEGVAKYGIREASKQFEEVYPSLRYMTYGDIRKVKYCIKVKASGLTAEAGKDLSSHSITDSVYPIVRIQCYKVVPCDGTNNTALGVNKLVEAAPPDDLAIMIHATGKTIKTILYGGSTDEEAIRKQCEADSLVPTRTAGGTDYIPGSCFAVHDPGFDDDEEAHRDDWFTSPHDFDRYDADEKEDIITHQINYSDTFWLTDLYIMQYDGDGYALYGNQTYFQRDGYSAWSWPRVNSKYQYSGNDSVLVNELVAVEPIVVEDTSWSIQEGTNQQYFDIYMRDVGFKIDEQNDFGEMVFIVGTTLKVSVLDGLLTGREFDVSGAVTDSQFSCVCAYNEDGTENSDFYTLPDSPRESTGFSNYAQAARNAGAIWRIRLLRLNNNDQNYANLDIILPTKGLEAKAGDHVVFLDIFMPDIYIHAAENRLLREAKKYLEANDKGSIQYSVDFDKVRIQQIPNYALQMREGLNIRMKDADLDIETTTGRRVLADYTPNGLQTDVQLYSTNEYPFNDTQMQFTLSECPYLQNSYTHTYDRGLWAYVDEISGTFIEFHGTIHSATPINTAEIASMLLHFHDGTHPMHDAHIFELVNAVKTFTLVEDAQDYTYELSIRVPSMDVMNLILKCQRPNYTENRPVLVVNGMWMTRRVYDYTASPRSLVSGMEFYCKSDEAIDFRRGKYYDVTIDVPYNSMVFSDVGEQDEALRKFCLAAVPASDDYNYVPEYTYNIISAIDERGKIFKRIKFSFHLDDVFNDEYSYKPAILFVQDGSHETGSIRLVQVMEKDIDSNSANVDYVDLKVDSVTVKITDNTRPADQRIQQVYPQPIYEIQANFKSVSQASSWAAMAQEVKDMAVEQQINVRVQETIANMARRHYQDLLKLRGNIFDPDGTCDQTFLQVMMLQVGADSMNYQLDKTKTTIDVVNHTPTQVLSNCSLAKESGIWKFRVNSNDKLRHFVYTQGAQGGTWNINGGVEASLTPVTENNVTTYPTYFVCLRCEIDGTTGSWKVTTHQYAVNEDNENFWYFNWGILQPDDNGDYSLVETRGNAYMYGDSLIAGRISSLAGNSYFDLTTGNFVLAKDASHPALSYVNGVLTIGGIDNEGLESVMSRLELIEDNISDFHVGTRNYAVCRTAVVSNGTKNGYNFTQSDNDTREFLKVIIDDYHGQSGHKTYASETLSTAGRKTFKFTLLANTSYLRLKHDGASKDFTVTFNLPVELQSGDEVVLSVDIDNIEQAEGKYTFKNVKIEKGNVATDWTPAPEDVAGDISSAQTAANNALTKATNIADDGIISGGTEKYALKKEWQEIAGDDMEGATNGSYYKARALATSYGLNSNVGGSPYSLHAAAYSALWNAMTTLVGYDFDEDEWTDGKMDVDTYLKVNNAEPTHPSGTNYLAKTRDEFSALWRVYYDAEIALLNQVSDTIDSRVVGGENLLFVNDLNEELTTVQATLTKYFELTYFTRSGNTTTHTYLPAGDYVFSAKSIAVDAEDHDYQSGCVIQFVRRSGLVHKTISLTNGAMRDVRVTTTAACYVRLKVMADGEEGAQESNVSVTASEMQLQRGTKSTSYTEYIQHLTSALQGTTDISGGLVMTNVMMLKNEDGDVTAGMSGLSGTQNNPENVLMWGGATYQEALYASNNDYKKASGSAEEITTLMKKDGTGKMGVFRIADDKVVVKTSYGQVEIDDTDGISLYQNNKLSTMVTPKQMSQVPNIIPSTDSEINGEICIDDDFTLTLPDNASYATQEVMLDGTESINGDFANMRVATTGMTLRVMSTQVPVYLRGMSGNNDFGYYTAEFRFKLYRMNGKKSSTKYSTTPIFAGDWFPFYVGTTSLSGTFNAVLHLNDKTFENLNAGYYSLFLEIRAKINETGYSGKTLRVFSNSRWGSVRYCTITSADPITVVASDGVASVRDSQQYFRVDNSGAKQRIVVKGLSGYEADMPSGSLYVDKGTTEYIKQMCSTLKNAFSQVNFSANADDWRDEINSVMDGLINELKSSSIIAIK